MFGGCCRVSPSKQSYAHVHAPRPPAGLGTGPLASSLPPSTFAPRPPCRLFVSRRPEGCMSTITEVRCRKVRIRRCTAVSASADMPPHTEVTGYPPRMQITPSSAQQEDTRSAHKDALPPRFLGPIELSRIYKIITGGSVTGQKETSPHPPRCWPYRSLGACTLVCAPRLFLRTCTMRGVAKDRTHLLLA